MPDARWSAAVLTKEGTVVEVRTVQAGTKLLELINSMPHLRKLNIGTGSVATVRGATKVIATDGDDDV
eukprot:28289-Eustigmatos_ZCMA.PRE.1